MTDCRRCDKPGPNRLYRLKVASHWYPGTFTTEVKTLCAACARKADATPIKTRRSPNRPQKEA